MNITIPIDCEDGHQFLLKLTDCRNLPIEPGIEIVDIALIDASSVVGINNAGTLNRISLILLNFLEENDVVLYFYCAKDPIRIRTRKEGVSYQQYRSRLFCSMYDRVTNSHAGRFINKSIVLRDSTYGDHYIHLISKVEYSEVIESLEGHLSNFNK